MIVDEQYLVPLLVTNKGILRLLPNFRENYYEICNANDYILMQFTGHHDTKGKEIYEKDIVRWNADLNGGLHSYDLGVVEWDDNLCSFGVRPIGQKEPYMLCKYYAYTIVGNIYDNPELIEKEE